MRASPVVKCDVRFAGTLMSLHVGVWFRDKGELERLIDSLCELRDSTGDENDHVHVQHYELVPGHENGLAEVCFFRPGRPMSDSEKDMVDQAKRELDSR